MDLKKVLIVTGKFDETAGTPNIKISEIFDGFDGPMLINGGGIDLLKEFFKKAVNEYSTIIYERGIDTIVEIPKKMKKIEFNNDISSTGYSEYVKTNGLVAAINLQEIMNVYDFSSYYTCDNNAEKFFELIDTILDNKYKYETTSRMERLHLRVINGTIDILYRPIHTYINFVPDDDNGRAEVLRLINMSREEFKAYLRTVNGLPRLTKSTVEAAVASNSDSEKWWKGAWMTQTNKLLAELGVENPIEEPIYLHEVIE